jgi:hypothetical protein
MTLHADAQRLGITPIQLLTRRREGMLKLRPTRRLSESTPRVPAARIAAEPAKTSTPQALTAQLEAAFRERGLSEAAAKIAAQGRVPAAHASLAESGKALGLSPAAAEVFARGRGRQTEAATKNVAGLSASSFAYVPDPEDPTTWRLQIARREDSGADWSPDEDLVRAAVAQLPGSAGYDKELDIPDTDLPKVLSTLYSAWIACGASIDEMPAVLTQEAWRRSFEAAGKALGLSGLALQAFIEGRK